MLRSGGYGLQGLTAPLPKGPGAYQLWYTARDCQAPSALAAMDSSRGSRTGRFRGTRVETLFLDAPLLHAHTTRPE